MKKTPNRAALKAVALLLAFILLADLTTEEMRWSAFDYLLAIVLLTSVAFLVIYIRRKLTSPRSRIAATIILAILFILVWGELAVGLFGTPWAGN